MTPKKKSDPMPKGFKEGLVWLLAYHTKKVCIFLILILLILLVSKLTCVLTQDSTGKYKLDRMQLRPVEIPIKEKRK